MCDKLGCVINLNEVIQNHGLLITCHMDRIFGTDAYNINQMQFIAVDPVTHTYSLWHVQSFIDIHVTLEKTYVKFDFCILICSSTLTKTPITGIDF